MRWSLSCCEAQWVSPAQQWIKGGGTQAAANSTLRSLDAGFIVKTGLPTVLSTSCLYTTYCILAWEFKRVCLFNFLTCNVMVHMLNALIPSVQLHTHVIFSQGWVPNWASAPGLQALRAPKSPRFTVCQLDLVIWLIANVSENLHHWSTKSSKVSAALLRMFWLYWTDGSCVKM